jgi:hypothetical protein
MPLRARAWGPNQLREAGEDVAWFVGGLDLPLQIALDLPRLGNAERVQTLARLPDLRNVLAWLWPGHIAEAAFRQRGSRLRDSAVRFS